MDIRKAQIKDEKLQWKDINFKDLKNGNVFRLFESTGEEVFGLSNKTDFIANSDAYLNDNEIWQIGCEEII